MSMEEESETLLVHVYTQISRLILLLKSHALRTQKKATKEESMKRFLVFAYHLQYHWEFELNAYQLSNLHF